ncbi:hypothetical protein MKQ70_17420 [Chitinophaga sedimenti]|uniref:hypothetical protein n=1 Tax=Chitinophaga sedimenti TaxID=2033606 RepID=UPI00200557A1|nr:hypothetical protein [Chitinophaga sedimenti]MCK7556701.1 hypothetical protein [Chitinophaga sedimenti]
MTKYGDNAYINDTISTTNYLILRKIKKLILENQEEMKNAAEFADQMRCLEMAKHLKEIEMELTKTVNTVILK